MKSLKYLASEDIEMAQLGVTLLSGEIHRKFMPIYLYQYLNPKFLWEDTSEVIRIREKPPKGLYEQLDSYGYKRAQYNKLNPGIYGK